MRISPIPISTLPPDLPSLRDEAEREGFHFLTRLQDDFASGANRFDKPGEALFEVRHEGALIAVGGVNIDPYSQTRRGRVRRVYVRAAWRGRGVGRLLLEAIQSHAAGHFDELVLFTPTVEAARFYERLGYTPVQEGRISHVKRLETGPTPIVTSDCL